LRIFAESAKIIPRKKHLNPYTKINASQRELSKKIL